MSNFLFSVILSAAERPKGLLRCVAQICWVQGSSTTIIRRKVQSAKLPEASCNRSSLLPINSAQAELIARRQDDSCVR